MGAVADYLMEEFGWYEGIALAMERARGFCEYCKEDLLECRPAYSSIVMDHLLPKAHYPIQQWNFDNHVLSCGSCNTMKGNLDPLMEGEVPDQMLSKSRSELIRRVRSSLAEKIDQRTLEWESICKHMRESCDKEGG